MPSALRRGGTASPGAVRAVVSVGLALGAWTGSPCSGHAQAPLFLVDPSTQVRSLEFDFDGGRTFSRSALESRVALTSRGALAGLRGALSFLPLLPPVGEHLFDPVELHRDVRRLERFYQGSGFLGTDVQYDVRLDTAANLVDVRFMIREGRPVRLVELSLHAADGGAVEPLLDTALVSGWARLGIQLRESEIGNRAGPVRIGAIADRVRGWLRDRGYPNATTMAVQSIDSTLAETSVSVRVEPGPRRRIGAFSVEGNEAVSDAAILREFPLSPRVTGTRQPTFQRVSESSSDWT